MERRPLGRHQTHGPDEADIDRTRAKHHAGIVRRRHVGHVVACVRGHAHAEAFVKPVNAVVRPAKNSAGGVAYQRMDTVNMTRQHDYGHSPSPML